jgi:hypothetical protein
VDMKLVNEVKFCDLNKVVRFFVGLWMLRFILFVFASDLPVLPSAVVFPRARKAEANITLRSTEKAGGGRFPARCQETMKARTTVGGDRTGALQIKMSDALPMMQLDSYCLLLLKKAVTDWFVVI